MALEADDDIITGNHRPLNIKSCNMGENPHKYRDG